LSQLTKSVLVFTLLSLTVSDALATDALVKGRATLRSEPSTAHVPIMILDAQERVELIDPSAISGYYHVRTLDGEDGWVQSQKLQISPSG
jgi:uncharacterized protein YgiM (DUF1202 family)